MQPCTQKPRGQLVACCFPFRGSGLHGLMLQALPPLVIHPPSPHNNRHTPQPDAPQVPNALDEGKVLTANKAVQANHSQSTVKAGLRHSQSKFSQTSVGAQFVYSQSTVKIQSVKVQSNHSWSTVRIQPKYSHNTVSQRTVKPQSTHNQNTIKPQSVKGQSNHTLQDRNPTLATLEPAIIRCYGQPTRQQLKCADSRRRPLSVCCSPVRNWCCNTRGRNKWL